MHEASERDLLARCRNRDETAWRELYRLHAPIVERFLRSMGTPDDLIDDALQRVFIELLRSIGRFRGDARLSTYLYRIAARVAQRAGQRRNRWLSFFSTIDDTAVAEPEDHRSPEEQAIARGALGDVETALEGLAFPFRVVWVMREIEGLSTDDVAAALDIPVSTVRTRHFRARKQVLDAVAAAQTRRQSALRAAALGANAMEVRS